MTLSGFYCTTIAWKVFKSFEHTLALNLLSISNGRVGKDWNVCTVFIRFLNFTSFEVMILYSYK